MLSVSTTTSLEILSKLTSFSSLFKKARSNSALWITSFLFSIKFTKSLAISSNLGLLVCGEKAGWSKLKKANQMGVPRVVGLDGFNNFMETGEFAE